MSYRKMMYIALLLLPLTLAGCATFSGGDSPEERQKAEMTKDDLWNQAKALEKEKAADQKRLADQQEEIARLAKNLSDQQTEIARANTQVGELNKSVDELNAQMRQLQEARQREHPLKEIELTQPKKETAKSVKKTKAPKKEPRKATAEAKAQEQQSTDMSAMKKEIAEAKQKLSARKAEPETPQDKTPEMKPEVQPAAPEKKTREARALDDLSLQMKLFEEGEQRESAAKETGSAQVKKGAIKEDKSVAAPKQTARKEPAEAPSPRPKNLTIKVLSGDGDIASAQSLSKRLGKMGYRVKLIDKAPRSDFNGTVVYYDSEHRTSAETMAKRLGGGTATRPLTWSSSFDIIVVTGRRP
jgi:chromosome segregation ATPase